MCGQRARFCPKCSEYRVKIPISFTDTGIQLVGKENPDGFLSHYLSLRILWPKRFSTVWVLFLSRKRTEGLPGAAAPGLLALDGGNAVDVGENLTQGTGGGVVLLHVTVVFHHGELLSCVERLTSD